ncbi:PIN domain-containing protein [Nocardioides nitrophenolicus]|uniref:PIN domain-containing protein n=1 Tax=Nocardioides nitrophenolicus TaxID=60489 RepID=UPI00195E571C|nr:PIN domain-containing protein [Nocardioides nitrophenolicus]MBM7519072.1 putative nucleic acid-binding protein [Nocardioides nitrophenolicus]
MTVAVVDTDVFSHLFIHRSSADPRLPEWRDVLRDRRVLISFQTRAEVLAGALVAGWGPRRLAQLRSVLDRTPTIRSDNQVVEAHADLTSMCRRTGHALHAKHHAGDRWIAASAIAKGVELLAGDGIYLGAPGLSLIA